MRMRGLVQIVEELAVLQEETPSVPYPRRTRFSREGSRFGTICHRVGGAATAGERSSGLRRRSSLKSVRARLRGGATRSSCGRDRADGAWRSRIARQIGERRRTPRRIASRQGRDQRAAGIARQDA